MYVAPLVVQLRIPTLLPPEELTLGLEYLISLSGLKVSPGIISLGALDALVVEEDLKEDGLLVWVAEDIVFVGLLIGFLIVCSCYIILRFMVCSIFCFGKIGLLVNDNSKMKT